MLVHIREILNELGDGGVVAFNTLNLVTTQGIVSGAEAAGLPAIIQVSPKTVEFAGLKTAYEIAVCVAKSTKVKIALHIDHGKDMDMIKEAVLMGFSSVMVDHSSLPFDQNVKDTKEIVDFAHKYGTLVQGEIGKIYGSEDYQNVTSNEANLTSVEDAVKYVDLTGIDTLAGAFGTIHGQIKLKPDTKVNVDIERIRQIAEATGKPLVLHGASNLDKDILQSAVRAGVKIVNVDTDLRKCFRESLDKSLAESPDEIDPRVFFKPVISALSKLVCDRLKTVALHVD
jgi:ketose-bisphosphate aldolase